MGCCNGSGPLTGIGSVTPSDAPGIQIVYGAKQFKNPLQVLMNAVPRVAGRLFKPPKVHEDGSIEYEKADAQPPEISGYQRDAENPFLFRPLWPACRKGMYGLKANLDGAVDVNVVCNCSQAETYQKKVLVETCLGCPFKDGQ